MPARTRHNVLTPLSPGQALYVLERLARDRVISAAEISRYVAEIPREIAELEGRLYRLRGSGKDGAGPTRPTAPPSDERKRQATPAGTEAKRLGGRFAGLIRRLPHAAREQYHAIKAKDGVEAAIRALQNRRK